MLKMSNVDEYEKLSKDGYKFEGRSWVALVVRSAVPDKHTTLIAALQALHDGNPVQSWYSGLQELADRYSLQFNPPAESK